MTEDELFEDVKYWKSRADLLMEAMEEIARGEGRFSRDPFTHACNTIDDMKQIALTAIAAVRDLS